MSYRLRLGKFPKRYHEKYKNLTTEQIEKKYGEDDGSGYLFFNYGSPEEFKEIFSNPRYGFVLDVTHAYTNDQTGGLARELINHYRPKIKQIHCSGYFVHGEDEQQHFPAHLESKYWGREENLPHHTILSDVIEEFPIIIESVLPDDIEEKLNPLTKEFAFIRNYILDKKES